MPPRDPSGLVTAAAELAEDGPAPWEPQDGAQPSLFGALPAAPDAVGDLEPPGDGPAPRGPGRPPGSRNRSTEEWRRWMLTRYRSPLIALAELAQANPHRLAAELSVEGVGEDGKGGHVAPIEAARLSLSAAQALAPYLHQRMPQAVEAGEGGLLQVVINGASAAQLGIVEGVQYQPLSDDESEPSE